MKLNIMGKIVLGFGIVLLLMLGTCWYLISATKGIITAYNILINRTAYSFALTEAASGYYSRAAGSLRGYIINGDYNDVINFQNYLSNGDKEYKAIAPLLTTDEEKQRYTDVQSNIDAFKKFSQQVLTLVKVRESSSGPDLTAATNNVNNYYQGNSGVIDDLDRVFNAFSDSQSKLLGEGDKQISANTVNTITISTVIIVFIIILGLIIAIFIARFIANPIRLVESEAKKIAVGDLTGKEINVKAKDEAGRLAHSFNNMLANLKDITRQLQDKSQTIASSAAELSASAESVSSAANETASTVGEVASTVEQVTVNAQRIAEASAQAAAYANEGNEGLANVVTQMHAIQDSTSTSAEVVGGLSESASKITRIVEIITNIADQTNLLALNAAIESARAGEHGRGFAVVAEEVMNLAEQSAGAAKDIYGLITTIQQDSQKAVETMKQSSIKVETGTQVVREVRATINKIISAVQGLADDIQSVAAATKQMSSGVQNVAAATEEQTATMDGVASTTQRLADLADELDKLSKRFRLV